ncbi:MAG: ATP-binding protein [Candidatus Aenigmarchaeota archaeon]|nr:ATP-binding protein [Candidatus Aenigmarchaeota archaeon]
MDKDTLLDILNDWNLWKKDIESGKERKEYLEQCARYLTQNTVLSIIGVRRSGKSYLMRQFAKKLKENTAKENILIINFEDARFTELYPELLQEVYEVYVEFINPTSKPFIFLDEIHNVPKWEKWVRTMHELGKAKIIISGSSSKLLSGELATVLTGRHLDIYVSPFDFKEFLSFRNLKVKDKLDLVSKKIRIKRLLREYFEFGGFPEIVLGQVKKQLLLEYFNDIITKDIERRYNIRKSQKLKSLARYYLTNISREITFNSIKKFLGISVDSIELYSAYLEEANLLFFLTKFHSSLKEQEKSPRKVYSIDIGLSNAVGFRLSENFGYGIENIVALKLKKGRFLNPNLEIYYWKSQKEEVDFVVKEGLGVKQLIQVCYSLEDEKTRKREIKALLKCSDELKCGDLLIITFDEEKDIKIKDKTIKVVPLWKWLLS